MMSAPLFLAILFYTTTLWSPSCAVVDSYIYSSHVRQQNKLNGLCRELVKDAEMKLKAVQHYRDQYYKSLQYQLGDIVYELRNSFKHMVMWYQFAERNASYNNYNHNENIRLYIEINRLAIAIETKVLMVREWQFRRARGNEHHDLMRDPLRSGAGHDYESEELLREGAARGRIAWASGQRPAPPRRASPAPGDSAKRKNKKWQYARGYEFV